LYYEVVDTDGARPGLAAEFWAYRLLWLTLRCEHLALHAFRCRYDLELRGSKDPHLTLALTFCDALESGNLLRACRLAVQVQPEMKGAAGDAQSAPKAAPGAAMQRLLAKLLEERGVRLRLLAETCRAAHQEKPPALLLLLTRLLSSPDDDDALQDLPVVTKGDPPGVDGRATAEKAEELLARIGPGQRMRLGEKSSDHMRGFVRSETPRARILSAPLAS